jgi:hypothetical protein
MQPLPGQRQRVEILWQLIRPDGREIGQVSQANAVPAGLLDGAWGKLAEDVVAAGAPAIVALLRRSGELPAGSGDGGGNSGGNGDDSE